MKKRKTGACVRAYHQPIRAAAHRKGQQKKKKDDEDDNNNTIDGDWLLDGGAIASSLSVNAHVIGRDASLMRTLAHFDIFHRCVCLCLISFFFFLKEKRNKKICVYYRVLPGKNGSRRDRLDFYDDGYY